MSDGFVFYEEKLDEIGQRVHSLACARAQKYLIAEAELLESIIEVDRSRLYERFRHEHLTPYCIEELKLTEDVAAMFVRVARKCQRVPELRLAIKAGEVRLTKAKTIASVITTANQVEWIEKAKTLSKRQLEREVAIASPVGAKPEKVRIKAETVRVEFELTHPQMDLLRRSQDLASVGKFASLAETEVALLEFYLDRKDPVRKAERAAVRRDRSRDRSRDEIPTHIVHALNRRDQGRCQGRKPDGTLCGSTRWVHHHHIKPRAEGGQHTLENLITLCSAHHRLWHRQDQRAKGLA